MTQNQNQTKQNEQVAKLADAAKANVKRTAEQAERVTDALQAQLDQNTDQAQRGADALRANIEQAAEQSALVAEAVKANIGHAAKQAERATDAARDGMQKITDIRERTVEHNIQSLKSGVETFSRAAQDAADRFTRTLGFSSEDSDRLALQSKQNMEAVARAGTVLTQAYQDASRGWLQLCQDQWQRNLEGMNRLTRAKSVQEFAAIQSELIREGLRTAVQGSRAIAETSLRATEDASRAFESVAKSPAQGNRAA